MHFTNKVLPEQASEQASQAIQQIAQEQSAQRVVRKPLPRPARMVTHKKEGYAEPSGWSIRRVILILLLLVAIFALVFGTYKIYKQRQQAAPTSVYGW